MNNSKTRPPIFDYPILSSRSFKGKLWNVRCFLVLVALSFLIQSTEAASITLNDGGTTKLEVSARDTALGLANQNEFLFPTSLPFDGSHVATRGTSHSQAQYHL